MSRSFCAWDELPPREGRQVLVLEVAPSLAFTPQSRAVVEGRTWWKPGW